MSPGPATTPREVGPTEDGSALRIRWGDGAESMLFPRALRLACPCAACVDELTGKRILRADRVPEDVHPLAIHYVGRYALGFEWSDGHRTGIYPFEYLRGLGAPVQGNGGGDGGVGAAGGGSKSDVGKDESGGG